MLQDLTPEQFVERFEAPQMPVVITGLTGAWPAEQQWTPQQLLAQYGNHKFKVCLQEQEGGGLDCDRHISRLKNVKH